MSAHRLDITWLVLIGLALATLVVPTVVRLSSVTNALVLALTAWKGRCIVLDFLDLRAAPALWRGLVIGWILIVVLFAWLASAIVSFI